MLATVWDELDYRPDICLVTNGPHSEHLQDTQTFQSVIQMAIVALVQL
jgi:hypothetical protein